MALERERKAALMQHLFAHGTRGEQIKHTEIGAMPVSWDLVRLGGHCEKPEYGYTASATYEPIGPKFLRITDVQDGAVNWASVPYCQCGETTERAYVLRAGDIVIARIGATTGKAYLIGNCPRGIFASYLIRVRAKSDLLPEFLAFYLQTEAYWKQVNQNKGGRLKGGVNIPVLQALVLPLPPLREQREIADILGACDAKVDALQRESALLDELFRAMLEELMTGRLSAAPLVEK